MLSVFLQPLREIAFDGFRPLGINLPRGVLPFPKPLVAEHVSKVNQFRCLHHLLGKLRGYEKDAAFLPQNHITRHHEHVPDACRTVDATIVELSFPSYRSDP